MAREKKARYSVVENHPRLSLLTILFLGIVSITLYAESYRVIYDPPRSAGQRGDHLRGTTALRGTFACLPYVSGENKECGFGLRTENGSYYAVDAALLPTAFIESVGMREPVAVQGIFVPIEEISSGYWHKYDIEGILRVTRAEKI